MYRPTPLHTGYRTETQEDQSSQGGGAGESRWWSKEQPRQRTTTAAGMEGEAVVIACVLILAEFNY